ncbi:MAG TPA: hypothetical protein O0X14_02135 [Methanocorpusculum sp.]|nr:hypothetical protein [Methanocorpusculum sp.]
MVNPRMKRLNYAVYSETTDNYGQRVVRPPVEGGTILIDIEYNSYSVKDNSVYTSAKYIGLSHQLISDKAVIDNKYKVVYINSNGRFNTYYLVDYKS